MAEGHEQFEERHVDVRRRAVHRRRRYIAAAAALAAVVVLAVVVPLVVASGPGASGPSAAAEAHDEDVAAGYYGGCSSFEPSGQGCRMSVVSTPAGARGTLYAVVLRQQSGDGTGRGAVLFFHGTTLITGTSALAPGKRALHGPGLGWVQSVGSPAEGRLSVRYAVSSASGVCTACVGDAGTDTYVYGWNGTSMTVVSGSPPPRPKVIGEG